MRTHFTTLIICFLIALSGHAQFSVSNYNSKSGFPHDLSYRLTEDSSGYLYIGTDNGLVRYNGDEFVLYNDPKLNSKYVIDVVPINDKKMALATWGNGIHLLNSEVYKSLEFKSIYFRGKYTRVLPLDSHLLAFANLSELSFFYKKNENVYETYFAFLGVKDDQYNIFQKQDSGLFFSIDGFDKRVFIFSHPSSFTVKGIIEIHGDRSISYPFPFLNPYMILGVQKLKQHYVALADIGLIYFNDKGILSIEKQSFPNKKILNYSENKYYKAFVLQDNETKLHEVSIITKADQSLFTLNSEQLHQSLISQLFLSPSNSVIWISTYGSGLYKLVPQSNIFKTHLLESKNCIDFKSIKGYHLFLSVNELFILDTNNQLLKTIAIDYSKKLNESVDEVSIFSHYNLAKIYSNRFRNLNIKYETKEPIKNFGSFKVQFGDNKAKVLTTKFNETIALNLNVFSTDLRHLQVRNIERFNATLYLATNQGIFAFDTLKFSPIKSKKLSQFKDDITATFVRNNKFWIATQNRILRYSLNDQLDTLNLPEYFGDNINDMLLASNGDVWLSSQKGFILFKNNQFYQINYKQGYPSPFTNKILEDKKSNIYLLGSNGVSIIKSTQNLLTAPPKLLVSNTAFELKGDRAVFESGQSLEFKVSHLNYYALDIATEYQFNNQAWQLLRDPSLQFLNLKDGAYSVQFRSRFFNSDFSYSKKYTFEIKSVWYLRPFFLFLWSFLALCVLTYFLFKYFKRLKKQNNFLKNTINENKELQSKLEETRLNVAQDFHDELGNKMAGISMLSEKLLNDKKEDKKANRDLLQRINRDSKELYSGIRDFIWSIDSKNNDLQELIFALCDFAEDLFQYSDISFIVTNRLASQQISLPLHWNRQLLLLFKEVMTNAFKHSKAKNVELIFDRKEDCLIVQFKDNGVGFNIDNIKHGNGLNNIYKRALRINGTITIESNSGTIIIFTAMLATLDLK
jgi:signal transduction histidine kinase